MTVSCSFATTGTSGNFQVADVRVISFIATLEQQSAVVLSEEHDAFGWYALDQPSDLVLPDGYKR